jgi:hypothetical protein
VSTPLKILGEQAYFSVQGLSEPPRLGLIVLYAPGKAVVIDGDDG